MNAKKNKAVIIDFQMLTACGLGIDKTWSKLIKSETAITKNNRFITENFISDYAALITEIKSEKKESPVLQMLNLLLSDKPRIIQHPDLLLFGTTVGEINYIENAILENRAGISGKSITKNLTEKCQFLFNAEASMHVSAACASSSVALIQAAEMIANGEIENSVVVGCDAVSEFVFSGFSALLALDKNPAKPFDKNRNGLTVGEAAAYVYLTSEEYAETNNLPILAYISGGGISNDANHITGPSRDGSGLAQAISSALKNAELQSSNIGVISAHGTGTSFNDSMEIKAFKTIFKDPLPAYSVKGCIGHTMGAAGIIEVIIAVKSFQENMIPPTVGLETPDEEAENWVYNKPKYNSSKYCLSVNSGFGGINSAIVLENPN